MIPMLPMASIPAQVGLAASDYAVVAIYMLVLIWIGMWFRGEKETEGYLLGGRHMNWLIVAISYFVTLTSTLSMVGVPSEAYKYGVTLALQQFVAPIAAISTFLIFVRFFFKTRIFTPFQYLENRYDGRVRAVAALIFSFSRLIYIALVLYSCSKVFEGAAGWNVWMTIILIGVVSTVYTVTGGIRAVMWGDLFQFLVMVCGLALIAWKIITQVPGGTAGIFNYAIENNHFISKPDAEFFSFSPYIRLTFWLVMMRMFVEYLFYNSSDQFALQRLLCTSSYQQAKRSMFAMVIMDLPMMLSMWFIGLGIWVFYQHQSAAVRPQNPDLAMIRFIVMELPSPIRGLIIAALLAAAMSTLVGGYNSLATVFTKDFYLRFFRKDASERTQVRFSWWMTAVNGTFSILAALVISQFSESTKDNIFEVSVLWLSLHSILPAVFLLAVMSRRATSHHVLVAMGAGGVTIAGMTGWYLFEKFSGYETISPFYIGVFGMVVTLVVGLVLSRFGARRPAEELKDLTLWTLKKDDKQTLIPVLNPK